MMQKFILLLIFVIPVGGYAQKGKSKTFTGIIEFEEIWNLNEKGQRFIDSMFHAKLEEAIMDGSVEDSTMAREKLRNSNWMLAFLEAMNTYYILDLTKDSVLIKKSFPSMNEIAKLFDTQTFEAKVRQHTVGKIIRSSFTDNKYRYEIHRDKTRFCLGYKCYKVVATSLEPEESGDDIFGMGMGFETAEIWVTDELNIEANLIDGDMESYNIGFPLIYSYYYSGFPGLSISFEVKKIMSDSQKK